MFVKGLIVSSMSREGMSDRFVEPVAQPRHDGQYGAIGFANLDFAIGEPMVVHHLVTLCHQPVAQLGRLNKGDVVADAQRQDAPSVGYGSKSQIGQRVEYSSLAYSRSVQVMFLYRQFGTGKSFAHLGQLCPDALGEAVFVIQFFLYIHSNYQLSVIHIQTCAPASKAFRLAATTASPLRAKMVAMA